MDMKPLISEQPARSPGSSNTPTPAAYAGQGAAGVGDRRVSKRPNQPPALGEHHDGSFGVYMAHKKAKLHEVFDARFGSDSGGIFSNVAVWINGYTSPPIEDLKAILGRGGGRVEHWLNATDVTHVIAQNLPDAKVKEIHAKIKLKHKMPVVYPSWIVDSAKSGKLLPVADYLLPQFRRSGAISGFLSAGASSSSAAAASGAAAPGSSSDRPGPAAAATSSTSEPGLAGASSVAQSDAYVTEHGSGAGPAASSTAAAVASAAASPEAQQRYGKQPRISAFAVQVPVAGQEAAAGGVGSSDNADGSAGAAPPEPSPASDDRAAPSWNGKLGGPSKLVRSAGNDPSFMAGYFNSSRLHFIGGFRSHVQHLVATETAGRAAGVGAGAGTTTTGAPGEAGASASAADAHGFQQDTDGMRSTASSQLNDEQWSFNDHGGRDRGAGSGAGGAPGTGGMVTASSSAASAMTTASTRVHGASSTSVVASSALTPASIGYRLIAHVDIDCFFAQVALLDKPHLRDKPVAVAHAGGRPSRTSYSVKAFGDGMDTSAVQRQFSGVAGAEGDDGGAYGGRMAPPPPPPPAPPAQGAGASTSSVADTVVSHHLANSSAEISSANYPARAFGIHAGMTVGSALQLCPHLVLLPYAFDKITAVSEAVYRHFLAVTPRVQAVSCDEAFLDLSGDPRPAETLSKLRADIFASTGCTVSAGLAGNMLLAKLATGRAKPNGQYAVPNDPGSIADFLGPLKVTDLPGVGWATGNRLTEAGVKTVADLLKVPKPQLETWFGPKTGSNIYKAARGQDDRPVAVRKARKSVGAEVNWGIRFTQVSQAHDFLLQLGQEVGRRLVAAGAEFAAMFPDQVKGATSGAGGHRAGGSSAAAGAAADMAVDHTAAPPLRARALTFKLMVRRPDAKEAYKFLGHGLCDVKNRTVHLATATADGTAIGQLAIQAYDAMAVDVKDVRGVGIQMTKLLRPDGRPVEDTVAPEDTPAPPPGTRSMRSFLVSKPRDEEAGAGQRQANTASSSNSDDVEIIEIPSDDDEDGHDDDNNEDGGDEGHAEHHGAADGFNGHHGVLASGAVDDGEGNVQIAAGHGAGHGAASAIADFVTGASKPAGDQPGQGRDEDEDEEGGESTTEIMGPGSATDAGSTANGKQAAFPVHGTGSGAVGGQVTAMPSAGASSAAASHGQQAKQSTARPSGHSDSVDADDDDDGHGHGDDDVDEVMVLDTSQADANGGGAAGTGHGPASSAPVPAAQPQAVIRDDNDDDDDIQEVDGDDDEAVQASYSRGSSATQGSLSLSMPARGAGATRGPMQAKLSFPGPPAGPSPGRAAVSKAQGAGAGAGATAGIASRPAAGVAAGRALTGNHGHSRDRYSQASSIKHLAKPTGKSVSFPADPAAAVGNRGAGAINRPQAVLTSAGPQRQSLQDDVEPGDESRDGMDDEVLAQSDHDDDDDDDVVDDDNGVSDHQHSAGQSRRARGAVAANESLVLIDDDEGDDDVSAGAGHAGSSSRRAPHHTASGQGVGQAHGVQDREDDDVIMASPEVQVLPTQAGRGKGAGGPSPGRAALAQTAIAPGLGLDQDLPPGIDPSFLAALPPAVRAQVIRDEARKASRKKEGLGIMASSSAGLGPLVAKPQQPRHGEGQGQAAATASDGASAQAESKPASDDGVYKPVFGPLCSTLSDGSPDALSLARGLTAWTAAVGPHPTPSHASLLGAAATDCVLDRRCEEALVLFTTLQACIAHQHGDDGSSCWAGQCGCDAAGWEAVARDLKRRIQAAAVAAYGRPIQEAAFAI